MSNPACRGSNVPKVIKKRDNRLHVVCIETGAAFGTLVEAGLELLDISMVTTLNYARDKVCFEAFLTNAAKAERLRRVLKKALGVWAAGEFWRLTVRTLRAEDWQESWKRHFKTQRVARRIVIKPSWEKFKARPGDCVIELDPGMSFGTGQHFTTRSCLRLIDEAACQCRSDASLLDIGCGSGVLAIAAAKLGFKRVTGLDNDTNAVRIARENAVLNGVAARTAFSEANIAALRRRRPFDVVVANILAVTLEACAKQIAHLVARGPDARLILAGILAAQYLAVKTCYEKLGFHEVRRLTNGEWASGMFEAKRVRKKK